MKEFNVEHQLIVGQLEDYVGEQGCFYICLLKIYKTILKQVLYLEVLNEAEILLYGNPSTLARSEDSEYFNYSF